MARFWAKRADRYTGFKKLLLLGCIYLLSAEAMGMKRLYPHTCSME